MSPRKNSQTFVAPTPPCENTCDKSLCDSQVQEEEWLCTKYWPQIYEFSSEQFYLWKQAEYPLHTSPVCNLTIQAELQLYFSYRKVSQLLSAAINLLQLHKELQHKCHPEQN